MRICPNCKKLSREDDFCNHCGSAVYPDNCTIHDDDCIRDLPDESSYSSKEYRPEPSRQQQINTKNTSPSSAPKKKGGCGCLMLFIIISVIIAILAETDSAEWAEWAEAILDIFNELI
ncbi:MAG: hypothetical protein ACI4KF_10735 [Huintestinicola sp.]